jgi:uncharacterized UBP type Zn finger protein
MSCDHLEPYLSRRADAVEPRSLGCEECLASGDRWVHLRLCLACGHVGCCDSSKNKHATRHFQKSRHPVMKSFEPGEDWAWCYLDDEMVPAIPSFPAESPDVHYGA